MAKDVFGRFLKMARLEMNLAAAESTALWWNDPDLSLRRFFSFPLLLNEVHMSVCYNLSSRVAAIYIGL
jgi:hypothetical protein